MHGDFPDDPEGHDDDGGGFLRGWLPPEDRLWRHPSEVAGAGARAPVPSLVGAGAGPAQRLRARRASRTAGVVGAAAVAATVAVVLTLVDAPGPPAALKAQSSGPGAIEVSTTSLTTTVLSHGVMGLVASVRPSLVSLVPLDATTAAARMTGVVLPGGALVVTAASAVAGASQIEVVTADGRRRRGTVLGADAPSGVAVVGTSGGLVPATFADEVVAPDNLAVEACLCGAASTSRGRDADAAVGMVRAVGTGVSLPGGPELVDAIEADMPLGPTSWGGVLLDDHGRVTGILDGQANTGDDTMGVFVPAVLAENVALELAQSHRVSHGWLGIVCADHGPGATVTGFLAGSPAATSGLHSGDVVVAVDAHTVASLADLRERLYTMPPGSTVQLSVERAGTSTVVPVRLARTPSS